MNRKSNILALDPGLREIGFALLDGKDLGDYGVKSLCRKGNLKSRPNFASEVMHRLIKNTHPDAVVLETKEIPDTPDGFRLMILIKCAIELGRKQNVPVVEIDSTRIRNDIAVKPDASMQETATAIASRFPELRKYADVKDRGMRRYWSHLFTSVAAALTYQKNHENN